MFAMWLPLQQIVAPVSAWPDGWRFWLRVLVALVLLALTIWAITLITRLQRQRAQRRFHLELENTGNVRSKFAVWCEDSNAALEFAFRLNGGLLPAQVIERSEAQLLAPTDGGEAPGLGTARAPAGRGGLDRATRGGVLVADFLSTIAYLLPGGVGGSLLQMANQLRRGGYTVRRFEYLSTQATRLSKGDEARSRASAGARPSSDGTAGATGVARSWVQTVVQTTPIDPGTRLILELLVSPLDPYRAQYVNYRLNSQAVPPSNVAGDAQPVVEEVTLQLAGLSALRRYGPMFMVVVCALVIGWVVFWLIGPGA